MSDRPNITGFRRYSDGTFLEFFADAQWSPAESTNHSVLSCEYCESTFVASKAEEDGIPWSKLLRDQLGLDNGEGAS